MKLYYAIPIVGVAMLLNACGSSNLEKRAEYLKSSAGESIERKDNTISMIPDWYTEVPQKPEAVYSTGTAISQSLQFSVDKAVMDAKVALADRINGRLSASQKRYLAETSRGSGRPSTGVLYENERVAKNIIAEIAVNGYSVYKSKIVRDGMAYRAFVMLEFPLGDANDVMRDKLQRDTQFRAKIRAKRAFKNLDKETDKVIQHEIEKQKVIIEQLRAE